MVDWIIGKIETIERTAATVHWIVTLILMAYYA